MSYVPIIMRGILFFFGLAFLALTAGYGLAGSDAVPGDGVTHYFLGTSGAAFVGWAIGGNWGLALGVFLLGLVRALAVAVMPDAVAFTGPAALVEAVVFTLGGAAGMIVLARGRGSSSDD